MVSSARSILISGAKLRVHALACRAFVHACFFYNARQPLMIRRFDGPYAVGEVVPACFKQDGCLYRSNVRMVVSVLANHPFEHLSDAVPDYRFQGFALGFVVEHDCANGLAVDLPVVTDDSSCRKP